MKTPIEYTKKLKNGIITGEIVDHVLYSYNKRAKNYRDNRDNVSYLLRNGYIADDKYGNYQRYDEIMREYYRKKAEVIKLYGKEPSLIHKLTLKRRKRIYDYEDEFYSLNQSNIIYRGEYYDRDESDYVCFADVMIDEIAYYLLYEFPTHSYHQPISEMELTEYKGLEIIQLDELTTSGEDIVNLLSVKFCDKVLSALRERAR